MKNEIKSDNVLMTKESRITAAAASALTDGDMDNFVAASTPGGIEAQEAAGQADFVESQTLPIICPKEQLEKLGFVFKDEVDDIFVNVKFPQGWFIKPTDHSMWSDLIDPLGNNRGGIFYKAAFYDRSAHMHLTTAIKVVQNYDVKGILQFFVKKNKEILFPTEIIRDVEEYSKEYFKEEDRIKKIAVNWMNKNYPDNNDVLKYWD